MNILDFINNTINKIINENINKKYIIYKATNKKTVRFI